MIRQITVDYTKPVPCENIIAGRIGEHNAAELIIIPPEFLSANEKVSHYVAAFAVECNVIHSEPMPKESELKIPLWNQLTQGEFLTVQLEGYDSAGEFIAKSEPVRLRFLHSVCGEDVPADTNNPDFISDYLKNKHSHSNKDVIDNFGQDESGNPLYNGNPIGGGSGLTDEQAANLAENTEARHTHSNKEILDKFTMDEQGALLFDGQPFGSDDGKDPQTVAAQTVAALLESSYVFVSYESPETANSESSSFAMFMSSLTTPPEDGGFRLIYAPAEAGELTYTDPIMGTVNTINVSNGALYEFYLDGTTFETAYKSYVGEGVLDFFKSQILTDCVSESDVDAKIEQALKNGNYATKYDLVNYRHISQAVPASEVSYSNSKLEDKSGTIEGALNEAVDYVLTAIPAIQEEVENKQEKGNYVTEEQLEASVNEALAAAKESGEFDGADGLSAYQIWLNAGNTGTEADFLASLEGTDGDTPVKGVDYFTDEDKAEIVEEVAASLSTDEEKVITYEIKPGGYYNLNGTWVDGSTIYSKVTNLIPVSTGEKFLYTGRGEYQVASVLWYDDARNFISAEQHSGETAGTNATVTVEVPSGAAYVMFQSYDYDSDIVLQVSFINEETSSSILFGKKIVYDGDSICESRIYSADSDYPTLDNGGAYAKIIAEKTGCSYVNHAVGGARLVSLLDGYSYHSIVDNLPNLPKDGDLYCFNGGINDYWTSDIQLGSFDYENFDSELDTSTVCGALETIFRYCLNNFIGKPVVFVITHKIQKTAYVANANGKTFKDFHDAMVGICEKYSVPYYDAFSESGLNGWNAAQNNAFLKSNSTGSPDGCHPTAEGYKRYYVPQLISLFERIMPIDVADYEAGYINVLTASTDIDGSLYNSCGYKQGVEWSVAMDDESAAEGVYLSGIMSMSSGDIIRIKNIDMNKNAETENKCTVLISKLGTDWTAVNAETLTAGNSAVWDDSGQLVQFTAAGTYKYFRLQAAYIGPDSIVTINEPIE